VRILYFSDNISGHNHRFLTKLTATGHDVFFLNLSSGVADEGWLPEKVIHIDNETTFTQGSTPDSIKAFVQEFRSMISRVHPDLIHAGPVQSCGYITALSKFRPFVVMSWGSDLLVDSHQGAQWEHATREALQYADGFVCDCDTVRDAASHYRDFTDGAIAQFPWGIEPGTFSPSGPLPTAKEMPFGPDTIRLICTRSWEPIYGMDVLMEAFLHAYSVEKRLRLLLLGDGSERQVIQKFINRHSLADVVLTPGRLPESDMPDWFRSASAYLSCAKSDGTSVSLLQAMAIGLPVLVTNIPANREWVTEGQNGWLAANADDFADKIIALSQLSSVRREAISRTNRRIVAARADWNKNFPRLLHLYERLVRTKKMVLA
jgi:glycosyltransferase involved in cell wall biosynthesis